MKLLLCATLLCMAASSLRPVQGQVEVQFVLNAINSLTGGQLATFEGLSLAGQTKYLCDNIPTFSEKFPEKCGSPPPSGESSKHREYTALVLLLCFSGSFCICTC